jgi:hypothetical protein
MQTGKRTRLLANVAALLLAGAASNCTAAGHPRRSEALGAGGAEGYCDVGQTLCNGVCVSTQTDPLNCGACGQACATGQVCEAGSCACPAGQTLCDGGCTSTLTDPANCGRCGTVCATGTCIAGQCSSEGTGGSGTGGSGTAGLATGGSATGGSATGGSGTAGSATGGSGTGGSGTGGSGGTPGSGTGGVATGGSGTGGSGGTAGSGTGGVATGGGSGGDLLTGVETPTPPCTVALAPETNSSKLPDPFTLVDGTPVTSTEQWACRRAEILAMIEEYETGPKPPKPSSVTGSYSGGTLSITASDGGGSASFSVSISGAGSAGSPRPAIIAYGAASLPIPSGVATITFNNTTVGTEGSRGVGAFYNLYGSNHPAGVLMAQAWGVSRIIDVIEDMPEIGIDPKRIGVTGCSRNGKGALIAGAFDARIALTIPQESGSGGSACWRTSYDMKQSGTNVQTLSSACTEQPWFRASLCDFGDSASGLPFDHHMLMGLVAPRGLLIIDNTSMEWLGNVACYSCAAAGRLIFEALGVAENPLFVGTGAA